MPFTTLYTSIPISGCTCPTCRPDLYTQQPTQAIPDYLRGTPSTQPPAGMVYTIPSDFYENEVIPPQPIPVLVPYSEEVFGPSFKKKEVKEKRVRGINYIKMNFSYKIK